MARTFTESEIEEAALEWLEGLKYQPLFGPEIAPGEPATERADFETVILERRLREAIATLNQNIPATARDEALRKVSRLSGASLPETNRVFHRMLVDGVEVEYRRPDGSIAGDRVRLIDFDEPTKNDWAAVNQFAVIQRPHNRRPDIVIFVNGLPLAVIELKNAADENATIWSAFRQLQTYKAQIPALFTFNEAMIISDGLEARIGTLTSNREWFMPWRTVEGENVAAATVPQLETLIHGVFEQQRFLDLLRHFVVFEDDGSGPPEKKMAGYHQFHAVNRAIEATVTASSARGDRRGGVVWHTQGSGKSLTMAFFAGRIVLHPALANPTVVVITDRNDLDGQLFGKFTLCRELLRQAPVQAASRAELRRMLAVASGGIVFTTIQKFFPEERGDRHSRLSDRSNIVVIADEAHRSQYDFIDGFARHLRDALPQASFIGFTGTPLELTDKNTRAVFGDYISVYDIQRAVDDGATVRIYYESRLAALGLDERERPTIDPDFEAATEGEEVEKKERLKTKWAALEAVVGAGKRIERIAADIVDHFENRMEAMDGKGMIVCMSRRICVELYHAIITLRPAWHNDDDAHGVLKVVMTGAAPDPLDWQQHIRNKPRRAALANRFKDAADPFKLVIVRDMWLTGFDAPCLHTMYLDKPMRGHGLMQTIARVNRVFRDKPGGLIVDYLGLALDLKIALAAYTEGGGQGTATINQEEAVAIMLEKFEICCGLFAGFDRRTWTTGTPAARLRLLPAAQEHILKQEEGKARCLRGVTELSQAFALSVPHREALRIRDEVAFFQAVRSALVKGGGGGGGGSQNDEETEHAIRQIVSRAVVSDQVVDIFTAAGLKKPDISILSDEFLAEVRGMEQKNLAVELLRKLLAGEIKVQARKFLVRSRSFAELLEQSVKAYQNRAIEAAQVIEELIALAKEMRAADRRGEELKLTSDEVAFYDALEVNDSAVKVLGDEVLKQIARELVETVRRNTSIDWTVKESVRAKLRVMVKRVLRKYGYPPDKQEQATRTVLEQAELHADTWIAADEIAPPPFRILPAAEARPYENCRPLYSLKAAAGGFRESGELEPETEPEAWVEVDDAIRPARGLFVSQVIGDSMNRRIPNGAYCVFRAPVTGTRQGKVVLARHQAISDPGTGGNFTVKVYRSEKTVESEKWHHVGIALHPDTTADGYAPIHLTPDQADEVQIIAELVAVLGKGNP